MQICPKTIWPNVYKFAQKYGSLTEEELDHFFTVTAKALTHKQSKKFKEAKDIPEELMHSILRIVITTFNYAQESKPIPAQEIRQEANKFQKAIDKIKPYLITDADRCKIYRILMEEENKDTRERTEFEKFVDELCDKILEEYKTPETGNRKTELVKNQKLVSDTDKEPLRSFTNRFYAYYDYYANTNHSSKTITEQIYKGLIEIEKNLKAFPKSDYFKKQYPKGGPKKILKQNLTRGIIKIFRFWEITFSQEEGSALDLLLVEYFSFFNDKTKTAQKQIQSILREEKRQKKPICQRVNCPPPHMAFSPEDHFILSLPFPLFFE